MRSGGGRLPDDSDEPDVPASDELLLQYLCPLVCLYELLELMISRKSAKRSHVPLSLLLAGCRAR